MPMVELPPCVHQIRQARPLGLRCEYPVPEEAFMVAELEPGALAGRRGLVKYRPEFGEV